MKTLGVRLLIAVIVLSAMFAVGWATREMSMPVPTLTEDVVTTAEVRHGEVGSTITLGASIEWQPIPLQPNQRAGTLTDIAHEDRLVHEGEALYTVDLVPTLLGEGDTPLFRALEPGVTGEDVRQVQAMLTRLGHYAGPVDGVVSYDMTVAASQWQRDLGLEADGIIVPGDIVFVAQAPLMVRGVEGVQKGQLLGGGETVVVGIGTQPTIVLTLTDLQLAVVHEGMRVTALSPEGDEWIGVVGQIASDAGRGGARAVLETPDGLPLCGSSCDSLAGQSALLIDVQTRETVTGFTLPIAAVRTDGAGHTSVRLESGSDVPVTILTTANGVAVLASDGLSEGDRVVVAP